MLILNPDASSNGRIPLRRMTEALFLLDAIIGEEATLIQFPYRVLAHSV
jgi:hypothetical protein